MRIEPTAEMEKRLPEPSRSPRQNLPNHSRKGKRRSGRRNNLLDTVLDTNGPRNGQDGGLVSGVEYPRMLWQSANVPQSVPGNGQRLFTAMSDPSVCSYSPMPVTYTMQPVSLPGMYRMYQPIAVPNIRASHGRHRRRCNEHQAGVRSAAGSNIANGYGSLQENGHLDSAVHNAYQNGDYASLPPTANKDSINSDELNAEHRRYSDPGLGPAENLRHSDSDSESIGSGSSVTTISHSNKLVLSLIEQVTELKKCNSQLFKELSETKTNLENVKVKLAYCKYSSPADYQPGMLSEIVREIREANKNYEESLAMKIKAVFEEKYNHQAKEVEELKNQITQVIREKEKSDQRVAKLEEEVTALKLSATDEGREIAAFEEEAFALRRELQEARASRTLAENHVAKLEKLVEILRRRADKATVTETVSRIRDVLTSGACPAVTEGPTGKSKNQGLPSLSSSDDEEDDGTENDDGDNDDDDDDDNVDDEVSSAYKYSSITSESQSVPVIDNSSNLSGPVTDL